MDYLEGFRDAVEMFEATINNEIEKITGKKDADEEEFAVVFNRVISTLYVAKLISDRMEDEYVESLEDNFFSIDSLFDSFHDDMDCDKCDAQGLCKALGNDKTIKKMHTKEEF